ncbi:MAG TPA: DUF4387 domain-containing protein [Bacillales bacterium]|nr:DUF4387 domain-containing protein [Bacillales bacterium]
MKLYELTKMIRAKNAGPFFLTIDLLFADLEAFEKVRQTGFLNEPLIAELYHLSEQDVQMYVCEEARAIKFSFPRPVSSGDFQDPDVFGGQQHAPLVNLDLPIQ